MTSLLIYILLCSLYLSWHSLSIIQYKCWILSFIYSWHQEILNNPFMILSGYHEQFCIAKTSSFHRIVNSWNYIKVWPVLCLLRSTNASVFMCKMKMHDFTYSFYSIEKNHVQFKVEPNDQSVDASRIAEALSK